MGLLFRVTLLLRKETAGYFNASAGRVDTDVIDLDAGVTAVLHPEELALGGGEIRPGEPSRPDIVDGDVHRVALEDECNGAPKVGGEIDLLGSEEFIGAAR